MKVLKASLQENMQKKENAPDIPQAGMAVLRQQYALAESIDKWIDDLKESGIFSS